MPTRCPETDTITVEGSDLNLQCENWSERPDGRHRGDHSVQLPPALGGEHTWPNTNQPPEDDAA